MHLMGKRLVRGSRWDNWLHPTRKRRRAVEKREWRRIEQVDRERSRPPWRE